MSDKEPADKFAPKSPRGEKSPAASPAKPSRAKKNDKPDRRKSWIAGVGKRLSERFFKPRDEYEDPYDDSWMEDTIVSQPFSVQHQIHVDFDSDTGFKGLPQEWEALLGTGAITKEEVLAKPDAVLSCLETQ